MFSKTAMALATASLALGAAARSPAYANYDFCTENPSAVNCPGNYDVTKESFYVAHRSQTRSSQSSDPYWKPCHFTRAGYNSCD
jgi:hypothetical protein